MRHAIVVGHPNPESFTHSVARTYREAAEEIGMSCIVRDLYAMNFDPRLQLSELPTLVGSAPLADAVEERRLLSDADVFAFVYPFWFNSPPAIVKGYIDRVFGMGFGYELLNEGGQKPLLSGRELIHLTSSGSRNAWLNEQGAFNSMRNLFDDYLGRVCGMRVRPHIHFDAIVPNLEERWVRTNLKAVQTKVHELFGGRAGARP